MSSNDGRRAIREQRELYRKYRAIRSEPGEPWFTSTATSAWQETRKETLAERIDRLERDLKMGKYASE